jgi:hypothetical protein
MVSMTCRIQGLAAIALTCLVGCGATLGLLNPPQRLLERAHVAVDERDLDTAYAQLVEIRKRYPESEQSAEAFPLAAAIFKRSYFRDRYARPDSPWVTSEPGFLLDWFASFFQAPEFPQAQAESLFIGMPYGYFRDFLAHAETRPEVARWVVTAEDDNGLIESIAAHPSAAGASN